MLRVPAVIRSFLRASACLVAGLLVVGANPAAAKEKQHVIERFKAFATDLDSGRASMVDVGVFEWSTDEERQALIQAFNEGGNKGAYDHLSDQDEKGFVKLPQTLGYQMRYAYHFDHEDKRQVVLATDRSMVMGGFAGRSDDNNMSFLVLQLDPKAGEGTGQMVFGAEFKVNATTGQLEIETLSLQPTRLTKLRTEKVKPKD